MNKLLPPLLCYALMTSQCFAVSGGPVFGNGRVSPIGFYSGVIRGVTETDLLAAAAAAATTPPPIPGDTLPAPVPSTVPSNVMASNAIGLFDLAVPGTGTATGAFLLFADGRVFTGVIDASADPSTATLSGILNGSFSVTQSTVSTGRNGTATTVFSTVSATAVGSINSKISNSSSRGSFTLARLTGTAFLDVSFGNVNAADNSPLISRSLTFTVSGFKQTTSTTSTVSAFTSVTGTSGSGGASGSGG